MANLLLRPASNAEPAHVLKLKLLVILTLMTATWTKPRCSQCVNVIRNTLVVPIATNVRTTTLATLKYPEANACLVTAIKTGWSQRLAIVTLPMELALNVFTIRLEIIANIVKRASMVMLSMALVPNASADPWARIRRRKIVTELLVTATACQTW